MSQAGRSAQSKIIVSEACDCDLGCCVGDVNLHFNEGIHRSYESPSVRLKVKAQGYNVSAKIACERIY